MIGRQDHHRPRDNKGNSRSRMPAAENSALAMAGATAWHAQFGNAAGSFVAADEFDCDFGNIGQLRQVNFAQSSRGRQAIFIFGRAPKACANPKTMPPSICCRARSGLISRPQSDHRRNPVDTNTGFAGARGDDDRNMAAAHADGRRCPCRYQKRRHPIPPSSPRRSGIAPAAFARPASASGRTRVRPLPCSPVRR